ncbi:AlbA family DNA-binding domain-containing protein [Pantoea sp. USHLN298]|uniref:AlbA family DNA-binding domain-containing protein n=1 Tax=Pantoea sp. USHLN298 TaxID=3081294 RepID=UPI00301A32E6
MNNLYENAPLFERTLDYITSEDLKELYELEEGWFVEFKSIAPENSKVAKSISSFANAYGGILIFGVIEDQKTRKAKSFNGMALAKAESLILNIRQSVQAHITPSPFYEAKIIAIPDTNDEFLVWVKIPKGSSGPYLHSSGVIYSRTGDSSSPIHLNDLGLLERMWREGESHRYKIKKRIELLQDALPKNVPRVEIFICEDESNPNDYDVVNFRQFKKLALEEFHRGSSSIFNSAYPLDSSFIAQRMNTTSIELGVLWDYDVKRRLHHISIPLATMRWHDEELNIASEKLNDYIRLEKYLISNAGANEFFIVDMSYCVGMISQILTKVFHLGQLTRTKNKLFINARVCGVKKTLAVLNFPKFYEELNSGVVPLIFRDPDFIYPLSDFQKWSPLKFSDIDDNGTEHDVSNAIAIFIALCASIGITTYSTMGFDENDNTDPEFLAQHYAKLLTQNYSFMCETNPHY